MNITSKYKNIETENIIWIIYLFIIGANFISNYYEEKYMQTMDNESKKIYRTLNIIVLIIALGIYIYFTYLAYEDLKEDSKVYKYFVLFASILVLIGGIIYLIVELNKNDTPEISII